MTMIAKVGITLEFLRPFAATNTAEFTFKPADGHSSRRVWRA
jgi:hypothetical protein